MTISRRILLGLRKVFFWGGMAAKIKMYLSKVYFLVENSCRLCERDE